MKDLTKSQLTPVNNLRGGNGVVYVSENFKIGNAVFSVMNIPSGSSIGLHDHPLEDGITEVYQVLEGDAARINGIYTKVSVCRPGESHNLINDTPGGITVLSIKSKR